ncbi:MAG: 2'-5' RNA ligase family protein [Ornithinimicrobium sp.]
MVQSVELVLDDAADAAIRGQWATLAQAGLPSQADHISPSNAPHVTVGVADEIDEAAETRLAEVVGVVPIPIRLGPIVLLGGRRVVLARMVVVTEPLLSLHSAVSQALVDCPGQSDYLRPGHWVPHVTLAGRLKPQMLPEAIDLLQEPTQVAQDQQISAVAMRRWDSVARRTWIIGG